MKALSGYAEWFWLIAKNWKDVENRNWSLPHEIAMNLPYRIYLHASKTPATYDELNFIDTILINEPPKLDEFLLVDWTKYRGHIIGETTITRQMRKFQYTEADHIDMGSQMMEARLLVDDPCRSRWFFGKFGFVCSDSILYGKPVPYRGQLGFFEVNLESDIEL